MNTGRLFRIFLSSTFSDFHAERDAIRQTLLPRLRTFCRAHGADCEMIDLRWGVPPEASDEGTIMSLCLAEVRRCREQSPRPNFILLVGDRYGWRPIPDAIPAEDYALLSRPELQADGRSIAESYQLDANATPSVARLRPGKFNDPALRDALDRALAHAALPADRFRSFRSSATELEIVEGALGDSTGADHVFAALRDIDGLPTTPSTLAGQFRDFESDEKRYNPMSALGELREEIATRFGKQTRRYRAHWTGDPRQPITTGHVENLVGDLETHLSRVIGDELRELEKSPAACREKTAQKAALHGLKSAAVPFPATADRILEELFASESQSFAIIAESGSGKSTLLAFALESLAQAQPGVRQIGRLLGVTPRAADPRLVVEDLLEEISGGLSAVQRGAMQESDDLAPLCRAALAEASAQMPVVLFLDGLDRLPGETANRDLRWIFEKPPAGCWILLSATPGTLWQQRIAEAGIPQGGAPAWDAAAVESLLDRALARMKRVLRADQRHAAISGLRSCRLPLEMQFQLRQIVRWRSFDGPSPPFAHGLPAALRDQLVQWKAAHGDRFVEAAVRLTLAARHGLSHAELYDLLRANGAVRREVLARAVGRSREILAALPETEGLPSLLWSRLSASLEDVFGWAAADGTFVFRPFHRALHEALLALLPPTLDEHEALVTYFRPRLHAGAIDLRVQSELPRAMNAAGRIGELADLLARPEFVHAKLAAGRIDDLLADFAVLASLPPGLVEIRDFLLRRLGLLRRTAPEWLADRILVQLAREEAGAPHDVRQLGRLGPTAGAQRLLLASVKPVSRGRDPGSVPLLSPRIRAAVALSLERAVSLDAKRVLRLWDLRSRLPLAVWQLAPTEQIIVQRETLAIADSSGEARWFSSGIGSSIQPAPSQVALRLVPLGDGRIQVSDLFQTQEPSPLTPSATNGTTSTYRRSVNHAVQVDWAPPQAPLATSIFGDGDSLAYGDPRRQLVVTVKVIGAAGDSPRTLEHRESLIFENHKQFLDVRAVGQDRIVVTGTLGSLLFDLTTGRAGALPEPPPTDESLGPYYEAARAMAPKNCRIRAAENGDIILIGESGTALLFPAESFNKGTPLPQPDQRVLDARFLPDGRIVLLGSERTLTVTSRTGDGRSLTLSGKPVGMSHGPGGAVAVWFEDDTFATVDLENSDRWKDGKPAPAAFQPRHAAMLPSGRHVMTWGDDTQPLLRIFDLADGTLTNEFAFVLPPRKVYLSRDGAHVMAWNNATTGCLSACILWTLLDGQLRATVARDDPRITDESFWHDLSSPAMPAVPPGCQIEADNSVRLRTPDGETIRWHDSETVLPLLVSPDGTVVVARNSSGIEFLKLFRGEQRIALDGRPVRDNASPLPRTVQPSFGESLEATYAQSWARLNSPPT